MYIHLGSDTVIRDRDIIGIFDIEKASTMKNTKEYLSAVAKRKNDINVSYEMPKSFVVAERGGKERVYINAVSTQTIMSRAKDKGV